MAGSVLIWTYGFQMNISANLKVSTSKSATSPSCKTLLETCRNYADKTLKNKHLFPQKLYKQKREKSKFDNGNWKRWKLKSRSVKIETCQQKLEKFHFETQNLESWNLEAWNSKLANRNSKSWTWIYFALNLKNWKVNNWKYNAINYEPKSRNLKVGLCQQKREKFAV